MKNEIASLLALSKAQDMGEVLELIKSRCIDMKTKEARHSGERTCLQAVISGCEVSMLELDRAVYDGASVVDHAVHFIEEIDTDRDVQKLYDMAGDLGDDNAE